MFFARHRTVLFIQIEAKNAFIEYIAYKIKTKKQNFDTHKS